MATRFTEGNAYEFFTVALNLAISTTLISYLRRFPAAPRLRRRHPTRRLPFPAPEPPALTVVSVA